MQGAQSEYRVYRPTALYNTEGQDTTDAQPCKLQSRCLPVKETLKAQEVCVHVHSPEPSYTVTDAGLGGVPSCFTNADVSRGNVDKITSI